MRVLELTEPSLAEHQSRVLARCSPGRILSNHTKDQVANLFADTLPSPYLADSGDPRPIQTKPGAMPVTTVLGVTKMSGLVHPDQNVLNATQNSLCRAVNRRRGCCACRASNCRRRARFSRTRSSRERKTLTNQPRKCRSDTIMARILAEKSESTFSPSHSFCRCTTFWRGSATRKGRHVQ